jgi:hypothetical protein
MDLNIKKRTIWGEQSREEREGKGKNMTKIHFIHI